MLTIPMVDDFYAELIAYLNVATVVAMSGGFRRHDADPRLAASIDSISAASLT